MRTKEVSQVLVQAILNRHNALVVGDPGVGKSDIVNPQSCSASF
jgi:MoxR-like ATPase